MTPPTEDGSDRARWLALCERLGCRGDVHAPFDQLAARYAEPVRAYHGMDHVRACLAELDRIAPPPADVDLLELAIWYHDAVYDPRAQDNEEQSAQLAATAMRALGLAEPSVERVGRLVLATKRHDGSVEALAPLLVDIDLSIFGAPTEAFARYEHGIRHEYAWVPEALYRRERGRILRAFLERPRIYQTDAFFERFEAAARANLHAAVAQLAAPSPPSA